MNDHLPSPAATPDNAGHPDLPLHPPQQQHAVGAFVPQGNGNAEEENRKIRQEVEARLLKLSQDLYELEICAGDVVKDQEDRIPVFMSSINQHFIALNDLARRMQDSVPRQVVESVDQYRNPHSYTKNALSRATGENQYALGRILGLESFRRQLEEALGNAMPDVPLPPRRHQPVYPHAGDGALKDLGSLGEQKDGVEGEVKPEPTGEGEAVVNGHGS